MTTQLNKLLNNEHLTTSDLFNLNKSGLITKITYTQYVITKKGLLLLNNKL